MARIDTERLKYRLRFIKEIGDLLARDDNRVTKLDYIAYVQDMIVDDFIIMTKDNGAKVFRQYPNGQAGVVFKTVGEMADAPDMDGAFAYSNLIQGAKKIDVEKSGIIVLRCVEPLVKYVDDDGNEYSYEDQGIMSYVEEDLTGRKFDVIPTDDPFDIKIERY